jgi:hypothetical protein
LPTKQDFGLLDISKNLSSQFFDLDIENPLGKGTLVKFESSLLVHCENGGVV